MIRKKVIFIISIVISIIGSVQSKTDTVETFTAPEVSAEFPGGVTKLTKYFIDNFTNKIEITDEQGSIFRSPMVQWTVDETGRATDARILRSTNISKADKLLLEVVEKMPLWKPAENGNKKVRQEFKFPITICFK
jgi:TonB family protein